MDRAHLAVRFAETCDRHAGRVATRIRAGERWRIQTFGEVAGQIRALAQRLVAQGVQAGDRVAIFATNRPEWTIADFACLSVRAVVVPLYPTSTPDQIRHILAASGTVWAFVEGASEAERIAAVRAELPELRTVVAFEPDAGTDMDWAELLTSPVTPADAAEADRRLAEASGDDIASLIYTSGTTGVPRGAVLSHRGFTFEMDALDGFFSLTPQDHSLCFLPLSHALERAWTYYVLGHGCMNTYTDARQVAQALVLARPTLLVSVPRLYEKVLATALGKVASSPVKKRIFAWALGVGHRYHGAGRVNRPGLVSRLQRPLADKLVWSSIRDAMGGTKTVMACGGAPLRAEVEEFFAACGLPICTGYGLTEASPLISFNSPGATKIGTAGRVVPGGELKVGPESELWYRGPNRMIEYWDDPEATAEAITADGWLRTGDIGALDADGYVTITDRIKDLIVTSGGKNIAPGPIEGTLLADPLIEQAVILGDNRPYLTLLVAPSMPDLEALATRLQLPFADRAELLSHPRILEEVRGRVGALTEKLARHEQIRDLRIMLEEMTLENGLLTPTLKVRRREVEQRFAHLVDEMYTRVADLASVVGDSFPKKNETTPVE